MFLALLLLNENDTLLGMFEKKNIYIYEKNTPDKLNKHDRLILIVNKSQYLSYIVVESFGKESMPC